MQFIDVKNLSDIQLMVLLKEISEEYNRIQLNLNTVTEEFNKRCEAFKNENSEQSKSE